MCARAQMALKLLVGASGLVTTDYYLTLDADVIALCPPSECWRTLLLPDGRGAYVDEPRDVHPHWWHGAEIMLGLEVCALSRRCACVTAL